MSILYCRAAWSREITVSAAVKTAAGAEPKDC